MVSDEVVGNFYAAVIIASRHALHQMPSTDNLSLHPLLPGEGKTLVATLPCYLH